MKVSVVGLQCPCRYTTSFGAEPTLNPTPITPRRPAVACRRTTGQTSACPRRALPRPLSQDARQASWNTLLRRVSRWRGARLVRGRLTAAPRAVRIVCLAALVLADLADNLVYHVARKPTSCSFVGGALDKEPIETLRRYEPLFRTYSTSTITPELLAAFAQVEAPAIRWRAPTGADDSPAIPFAVYSPLERSGHVPDDRCSLRRGGTLLYPGERCRKYRLRVHWPLYPRVPSHAIELPAVYLDRNVAAVLAARQRSGKPATEQYLAAFIHLCGAGPLSLRDRRFQMMAGERCGDHLVAAYLARSMR